MVRELLATVQEQRHQNAALQARLDQLLRRLYGPRSERINPSQLSLFDLLGEQACPASPEQSVPDTTTTKSSKRPHRHGRQRLPEHLQRQRVVHELTEAERGCPCCGQLRQPLGEETSEQLDYQPASLFVIQHVRVTYHCRACQGPPAPPAGGQPETVPDAETPRTEVPEPVPAASQEVPTPTFVTASKPAQPIERGLPGAGLLAHVIVSKYGDHLPLYRLERIFEREGVTLARSTLCDWMAASAQLLRPLYELMCQEVLRSRVIHTDDTPVRVQEEGRVGTRQGRLWVYLGDSRHCYTVYDFTRDRTQDEPLAFLKGYRGHVQADAYSGYDKLFASEAVIEVGCWAHARRKFYEAREVDPQRAHYVLGVIRQLYEVERGCKEQAAEQKLSEEEFWELRRRRRQESAEPLRMKLGEWLRGQECFVLPKSALGEAFVYVLNQWEALGRYTSIGYLEIDNNPGEQALRPIAVGRNNWLFLGSERGGQTAEVLFSFTQTCRRLRINPWVYLRDVLQRLPTQPRERLAELLPDRWAAARRAEAGVPP